MESESGSLKAWRSLDRTHRFWSTNEDALNVAAMITEHPVTIQPTEWISCLVQATMQ